MCKEEGAAAYASRIRAGNGSRTHSRSVSWAESEDAPASLHNTHPDPIEENDAPLSSSPETQPALPDIPDEQTPIVPPALPMIPITSRTEHISASPPTSVSSGTQDETTTADLELVTSPSPAPPTSRLWRKIVGPNRKDSKDSSRFMPVISPSKEKPGSLGGEKEEKDGWGNGSDSLRSKAKLTIGKGMRNSMHMGAGIVRTMGRVTGAGTR